MMNRTEVAPYESHCVELLLEKLDAYIFTYDIQEDLLRIHRAMGDTTERILEGYLQGLRKIQFGSVHPDFVEPLSLLITGQTTESQEMLIDPSLEPKGRYRWYQVAIKLIRDEAGRVTGTQGIIWDIESSTGQSDQAFARFRSERDSVTGIYNEIGLSKAVNLYIEGQGRDDDSVLLCIMLENFPRLAKEHGKRWGDQLLARICKSVGGLFRDGDVMAHLGEGVFVVFAKDLGRAEVIDAKINAIRHLFRADNMVYGSYGIHPQVGAAYYSEDGKDAGELLVVAMERMKLSIANGKK
ncbi:hypothetical protein TAMA11512_23770 [Selenomonas sp. TAMA-11512]|uniref:sensor domain-containing diguanylate cyclase n=1 Tax=Selenomonas sp. TAMA-11512 TaxID=3095337 RepID=UPI00308CDE97|nr:hypothetical protein TAMA11512_23770 [Selenomonas sp. TAMA-11512]